MPIIKKAIAIIFATGWLAPGWLGVATLFSWFHAEVAPRLQGDFPLNSFPYLEFAGSMLTLAGAWFSCVVVAFTVVVVSGRLKGGESHGS